MRKTIVDQQQGSNNNKNDEVASCLTLRIVNKKLSVHRVMYSILNACAYCHIVKMVEIDS